MTTPGSKGQTLPAAARERVALAPPPRALLLPGLAGRRRARAAVIGGLWAFILAGCAAGQDPAGPDEGAVETVSAVVSAADGGTVRFTDGTGIEIPPGALAEDTAITLSRPAPEAFDDTALLAAVTLEPHGLTLKVPAKLVLTYREPPAGGVASLVLVSASRLNDPVLVGGQVAPYAVVPKTVDEANRLVSASIEHFSWYGLNATPRIHLALELPGKYLRNGDILYALTGGQGFDKATAFPMHVGLFVEDSTHDSVIESTIPTESCTDDHFRGVAINSYVGPLDKTLGLATTGFTELCGEHIFMGARVPYETDDVAITDAVRSAAVAAAKERIGDPYGILTLDTPGWGSGTFGGPFTVGTGTSCVELAEDAWEDAGLNILRVPDVYLTPHAQFLATRPVDVIEVEAGEEVRIPLIGVTRDEDTFHYRRGTVTGAKGLVPMRLELFGPVDVLQSLYGLVTTTSRQGLQDFVFDPTDAEAGQSHQFHFKLEDEQTGLTTTFDLYIDVAKKPEPPAGAGPCDDRPNGSCDSSAGKVFAALPCDLPASNLKGRRDWCCPADRCWQAGSCVQLECPADCYRMKCNGCAGGYGACWCNPFPAMDYTCFCEAGDFRVTGSSETAATSPECP